MTDVPSSHEGVNLVALCLALARIRELEATLRPFAEAADIADGRILARYGDTDFPDDTTVAVALNITLGHIRAARAAIAKTNGDNR